MIDKVLQQLIDFLQEASPLVWKTLIKQVYVDAFAYSAWAIGLAVVGFLLIKAGNYFHARFVKDDEEGWWIGAGPAYLCSTINLFISFALLVSAIARFLNPEFYAIRYILYQISGR